MIHFFGFRLAFSRRFAHLRRFPATLTALALVLTASGTLSQTYDCAGLQAKIAELDRGGGHAGRGAGPSREQVADLNHTVRYARSLGCDQPVMAFFGRTDGRCPGLNAQIQQMQAAIGQLQPEGGARADLIGKFNAYCRNQPPPQPRQRGFFEQLFGIPAPPETPPEFPSEALPQPSDGGQRPHGGSQVVCVRTCDGGILPIEHFGSSRQLRPADKSLSSSLSKRDGRRLYPLPKPNDRKLRLARGAAIFGSPQCREVREIL